MKKRLLIFICLPLSAFAQTKTPAKPTSKPPAKAATTKATAKPVSTPVMKNATDSVSYALGMSLANFYKEQGITQVNTAMVTLAINDALSGKKPLLDESQQRSCINNYMVQQQEAKALPQKKAGQAFLATNAKKEGIVSLPSGLQYQVIKMGTGEKPTLNDKVKCHYHGTLIDGTVFDSSIDRGEPIDFPVAGVIKGWTEALQLMPVGSKFKLFIPSNLAYGDQQAGPAIKPGSTLIFDVELLEIVK